MGVIYAYSSKKGAKERSFSKEKEIDMFEKGERDRFEGVNCCEIVGGLMV